MKLSLPNNINRILVQNARVALAPEAGGAEIPRSNQGGGCVETENSRVKEARDAVRGGADSAYGANDGSLHAGRVYRS